MHNVSGRSGLILLCISNGRERAGAHQHTARNESAASHAFAIIDVRKLLPLRLTSRGCAKKHGPGGENATSVPTRRGVQTVEISGGKGSPSAHTAPSSKNSFFQTGTRFFNVSISQRVASKAAER